MLLKIHYVSDFPPYAQQCVEIRKGYFMEPKNKFVAVEQKRQKSDLRRKKNAEKPCRTIEVNI